MVFGFLLWSLWVCDRADILRDRDWGLFSILPS